MQHKRFYLEKDKYSDCSKTNGFRTHGISCDTKMGIWQLNSKTY